WVPLDHEEVGTDHRADPADDVVAARARRRQVGEDRLVHRLDHGAIEPCPVAEVAVEHRFAGAGRRRDLVHADAGAVPLDRLEGRPDELTAALESVRLPAGITPVSGDARQPGPARNGRAHDRQSTAYSPYRLQSVSDTSSVEPPAHPSTFQESHARP